MGRLNKNVPPVTPQRLQTSLAGLNPHELRQLQLRLQHKGQFYKGRVNGQLTAVRTAMLNHRQQANNAIVVA